jgi:hypothetical protein
VFFHVPDEIGLYSASLQGAKKKVIKSMGSASTKKAAPEDGFQIPHLLTVWAYFFTTREVTHPAVVNDLTM